MGNGIEMGMGPGWERDGIMMGSGWEWEWNRMGIRMGKGMGNGMGSG